jgi:Retinal pigment epithelial membrane protein
MLPCSGGQRSELTRVVLDIAAGTVTRSRLSTRACEFSTLNPQQNGRQYRHAYLPASAIDDPVKWGPNQVSVASQLLLRVEGQFSNPHLQHAPAATWRLLLPASVRTAYRC